MYVCTRLWGHQHAVCMNCLTMRSLRAARAALAWHARLFTPIPSMSVVRACTCHNQSINEDGSSTCFFLGRPSLGRNFTSTSWMEFLFPRSGRHVCCLLVGSTGIVISTCASSSEEVRSTSCSASTCCFLDPSSTPPCLEEVASRRVS